MVGRTYVRLTVWWCAMTKFVYDFAEGSKDLKDLLGGKGANLAEMTNMGLPVPPGFTITTEACKAYLSNGREPAEPAAEAPGPRAAPAARAGQGAGGGPAALSAEVSEHLAALGAQMGKKLGQTDDPLLVSVRSGAKFSMPGMMETVLNVGLNDESVKGLASKADGDDRFAHDR